MGVAPEPAAPVARLLDEIRSLGHRGGTTAAMRSRQLALSWVPQLRAVLGHDREC